MITVFGGEPIAGSEKPSPESTHARSPDNAWMFDATGTWVPAQEPVTPGGGISPVTAFIRSVCKRVEAQRVPPPSFHVVSCALGGQHDHDIGIGAQGGDASGWLWPFMERRLRAARRTIPRPPDFGVAIWMDGERDSRCEQPPPSDSVVQQLLRLWERILTESSGSRSTTLTVVSLPERINQRHPAASVFSQAIASAVQRGQSTLRPAGSLLQLRRPDKEAHRISDPDRPAEGRLSSSGHATLANWWAEQVVIPPNAKPAKPAAGRERQLGQLAEHERLPYRGRVKAAPPQAQQQWTFIDGERGDVFVHMSAFQDGRGEPMPLPIPGTAVRFEVGRGRSGKPEVIRAIVDGPSKVIPPPVNASRASAAHGAASPGVRLDEPRGGADGRSARRPAPREAAPPGVRLDERPGAARRGAEGGGSAAGYCVRKHSSSEARGAAPPGVRPVEQPGSARRATEVRGATAGRHDRSAHSARAEPPARDAREREGGGSRSRATCVPDQRDRHAAGRPPRGGAEHPRRSERTQLEWHRREVAGSAASRGGLVVTARAADESSGSYASFDSDEEEEETDE
eukprot:gene5461-16354_t